MKKTLIIFIVLLFLLIVAKVAYEKYCASKPSGCKKEKIDYEKDGLPRKGIEY